jgi:uncharacterized membrane protein YedE/YeeE
MSIGTIILIILIIALLGGFSGIGGGPFYGTGYYGGGGLGVVIVILLILVLLGRLSGLGPPTADPVACARVTHRVTIPIAGPLNDVSVLHSSAEAPLRLPAGIFETLDLG